MLIYNINDSDLIQKLTKQEFSSKLTGITYRSINHYQKVNLLINKKKNENSWKKFSAVELIWIGVISKLRELGVSLDTIAKVKENIFIKGRSGIIDSAKIIHGAFEYEIASAIIEKQDLFLIIFEDCTYTYQNTADKVNWFLAIYKDQAYISIPMKSIIQKILKNIY